MATDIHSTALVDAGAQIGDGVVIGPFTIVERGVTIEENVKIQSHAVIAEGAHIKKDCVISHGAVIGTFPQDLKFKGEKTLVEIGERTTIREYCTVNRGTAATGVTRVGADCLLMAYSHVAHDCRLGDRVILANAVQMGGHVHIGDWAIIGGHAGIHQFSRIGEHTMVGAMSYITKDIPPYTLVGGEYGGFSGVNVIGLKRRGFSAETVESLRTFYKLIYNSGLNVTDGISRAEKELQMIPEVKNSIEFIRASERGIVRGR